MYTLVETTTDRFVKYCNKLDLKKLKAFFIFWIELSGEFMYYLQKVY